MSMNPDEMIAKINRLRRPTGKIDVVMDTDTYNEADDQFALSYLLLSGDRLNTISILAAPFLNDKSVSPADGMEKSYLEIYKLLGLLHREEMGKVTYRGSDRFLPDEKTPVLSEAAERLIEISKAYSSENPLYIAATGAITNIASALLLDPTLSERICIVWLGGHSLDVGHTKEFNMMQDVAAARVVFRSGAPIVLMPAQGIVSHMITTKYELEHFLKGKSPLCDYLLKNTIDYSEARTDQLAWSKVIWDIAAIGYLLDEDCCSDRIQPAPIPEYDDRFGQSNEHFPIRYVYAINRDRIYSDLFRKLGSFR